MSLTLMEHCKKNGYTLVKQYTTTGEVRTYWRAIVIDNKTGETYYLYFDESRRRRTLAQQKRDYEMHTRGEPVPYPPSRGWRNTTLDNRRHKGRGNKRG